MRFTPLPFRAPLAAYERQADDLLRAWNQHDRDAVEIVRRKHPRFLDETIKWLPKNLSDEDLRRATLDDADARLALARWYDFADWPRLAEHVDAVTQDDSPVCRFESAVEAVISGDLAGLGSLLRHDPVLVRER
jgi:hypothetical protein